MLPTAILELLELLAPDQATWPADLARIRATGVPMLADDAGDDGDDKGDDADDKDGDDKGDKGTKNDAGDTWTPPSREEYDKLQEAASRSAQRARKLEREAEAKKQKDAQAKGEYEELYNTEKAKGEAVLKKLGASAVRSAVTEVATTLRFKNPAVAHKLINIDDVEPDLDADELDATVTDADKQVIRKRLEKLAEAEDYLVGAAPRRQRPGAGGDGDATSAGNEAMNDALRRGAGIRA